MKRIAVDIGGTFTDVAVFDEETGEITSGKALSTPTDLVDGIMHAMDRTAVALRDVALAVHGSTIVINAILERAGAKTALVTTQGFRDIYEIGRINRPESFNLFFRKHRPLVPRDLIFEVPERVLADGSIETPLDEDAARAVARRIREHGVEAVAVLFLHSYREPAHERRMREIVEEEVPGVFVSPSYELSREYREYERTSTAATNAYVGPIVNGYLGALSKRLDAGGFSGSLMIMQSSGGLTDVETARRQCIQMMESGPAGGVVGSIAVADALGLENAICFDMGGTTAKACVIRRGIPDLSPDYFAGGYNEGLAVRIPVLDIKEVGTGGGSIAWVDEGAALHVGPQSAGAVPGPVSYGTGGTQPTVTDANVTLGRISGERFFGGEIQLAIGAAAQAINAVVATPLGLESDRAASGIVEIAEASMANAVRAVTTERGLDPRDFTMIAYGGGGPLHASAVARELTVGRVVIPHMPAHFSAFGMLLADLRRDYVQTHFRFLADVPMEELEAIYRELEAEGVAALETAGVAVQEMTTLRAVDMRYVGQEHAVAIAVPANVAGEDARESIKQTFDAEHDLRFGHGAPDEPAQLVSLRVSVIGKINKPGLPAIASGGPTPPASARRADREAVLDAAVGPVFCTVYDRDLLVANNVISGPAIIEEPASSTVLHTGDVATVNEFGQLVIDVGSI